MAIAFGLELALVCDIILVSETAQIFDTHVKNLRKKIAEKLPGKELIQSVYGVGYKLVVMG